MSTILVVDDSMTDRQIVVGTLQQEGFATITADSEKEALDQINKQKPDLIVLDVVLPDRSGFEICRDLKEGDATKKIPIVLCSSKGSKMDKFWGMQQGADAYIAKPVNADELVEAVRKLI